MNFRICPLCRSEVEDEFHFSMICDKLKDICDKFFQKLTDIIPLFSNFSDLDKFFFIFRSNDYDINMCFIIRQQTIHSTTACRAEAYTNINIQIIYNEKYIT
jgi:hypothetical protein